MQKLSESHETIQKLTSHLQEMQDRMNSMNHSGEFQEVESNHSGRLSGISSQPAMIPISRSMLSRDKRLSLDTWNTSGLQENVFGNQFSTFDSHREFTLAKHKENEDQFHKLQGQGLHSQEMTNKVGTHFQFRHLQEGRRL